MAYGFTSKADNALSASGTTITVSVTVSAGDTLLVVWGGFSGTITGFTPTDGTHTYVSASAAGSVVSTLTHRVATYYVINPTPGSYTITGTLGASRANRRILAATYSGITAFQAAQPQGQVGAATTTDAVSTSNMTPSSQPALLTAISFTANGTATYTQGTGHTSRGALSNWDSIGSFSSLMEDIRLTSTSAVSGLFTIGTSRDTLSSGAVFTEAVGATVTGQTLTATASLVAGAVTASGSVAAQTLTATASLIAGTASATSDVTVTGQVLTATASLQAGSVAADSSVAGQVLTATASLVAGAVQAASSVAGQVLSAVASLINGTAIANDAAVGGQVLTATASLVQGSASGDAVVTAKRHRMGIGIFLGL